MASTALSNAVMPLVMGILNVTPDSFSDGGLFVSKEDAVRHACDMLDQGADIIDIGGESTRPPGSSYGAGAQTVSEAEELDRVIPVIQLLHKERPEAVISIDTTKSAVAQAAMQAGAQIINDVSAGTNDSEMFAITSNWDVPIILMHGYGPLFRKTSIDEYRYANVVDEVYHYLAERITLAMARGVEKIYADTGIGFAKGFQDNMRLLKHHERFTKLGVPLVLGASRKSSIGKALGRETVPSERIAGSITAAVYGAMHGAAIVRIHDVVETRDALRVLQAIHNAE